MAFCKNCGSPVEGQFCPKCGTPMAAPAAAPGYQAPPPAGGGYAPPQQQAYAPPQQQAYGAPQQQAYAQPAPAAAGLADNMAGMLCYAPFVGWIVSIVFLVMAPYNQKKFIRFCALQSLFLTVGWFVVCIAITIVEVLISAILPYSISALINLLLWLVLMVGNVGILVLLIVLMLKANGNQKWVLPIIGPMADKKA